jgi:TRAP transporter TAXI family solute receptor
MKMKCALMMCLLFFMAVCVSPVSAEKETTVGTLSAPFGTGTYLIQSAAEDLAKKNHPWLRIVHQETPGYVFNIKKLDKQPDLKKTTLVGCGAVLNWLASQGKKPLKKKYAPLKMIGNYFLVSNWLATLDPNIKEGKDLAGKKIALGRTTQINWAVEPVAVIRDGWGIKDKVKIQYVGTKPAATALLDGLVDAAIVGGYFDPLNMKLRPSPQTVELLASGRKIYFIPWGKEAVKKTIDNGMPIVPVLLPANTVKGQTKDMHIYTDTAGWWAAAEFPEKLAYAFTKLLLDNVTKFGEYGAIGKLMSPPGLAYGGTAKNLHPGALKAYREAGVIK